MNYYQLRSTNYPDSFVFVSVLNTRVSKVYQVTMLVRTYLYPLILAMVRNVPARLQQSLEMVFVVLEWHSIQALEVRAILVAFCEQR